MFCTFCFNWRFSHAWLFLVQRNDRVFHAFAVLPPVLCSEKGLWWKSLSWFSTWQARTVIFKKTKLLIRGCAWSNYSELQSEKSRYMVYSGVRMRAVACCIGSTLTTWQILESQIKLTLEGLAVSIASGKGHAVMRLKSLSEGMHSYCIALCVCACVNIHVNPIFCSLQHVPSDFNPKTSDTTKWPSQKTRNPTHLTSSPWVRFLLLPSDKDYETFQITSRSFGHQILVLSQPHGGGLDGGLEPWMMCSLPRAIHR